MTELEYLILQDQQQEEWEQVENLFRNMYAWMHNLGIMLPLESSGSMKWMSAARNTAEKFGRLAVAKSGDQVVAFAHGMIKFLPDYLGGKPVGMITHIFVAKEFRDKHVGAKLVAMLEDWFRSKKVHSVELQVITGNPDAMAFWKNLGYSEELQQFRKFID